jgi:hypothetical protein
LLHMFWTSSFNASLSLFSLALVIGLIGTSNGLLAWLRLVLGWSASIRLGIDQQKRHEKVIHHARPINIELKQRKWAVEM